MNNEELKNLIVYTGVYMPPETQKEDRQIYEARSPIWFETFDNAQKLGIKVVVKNDGGLPPEMLERIRAYSNITIVEKDPLKKNTLGSGRRETLQKAIEISDSENIENPIFLWTEPEKNDLITEKSLLILIAEVRAGSNIVVPERKEKAWGQLPEFRRWIEKRANKRANKIVKDTTGSDVQLDFWYAPKAFDKIGAEYFLKYNSNKDRLDLWDAIMIPMIDAMKDGKKVTSLPVDFSYNQKEMDNEKDESNREIKIKRIEQYAQILKEFGDAKWQEFFEEAKELLSGMNELNKENPKNEDDKQAKKELIKEAKNEVFKKFFKFK